MIEFSYVGVGHSIGGAAAITLSADFDSPTGGTPQTTASRTVTVPTGNSGGVDYDVTGTSGSPTISRSIDAGAFNGFTDGDADTFTNGQALRFRVAGAGSSATIQMKDNDSNGNIGLPFTITCT